MGRTGGEKTRARILQVAERLFAARGFDATSVDSIAGAAKVNKAAIYYHFRDKQDLVEALFRSIVEDIGERTEAAAPTESPRRSRSKARSTETAPGMADAIRQEIAFCVERQRIISLMLMEALKGDAGNEVLFRCAETAIRQERPDLPWPTRDTPLPPEALRDLVHEIFTGFIPLIAFVALQKRWAKRLHVSEPDLLDAFVEAFIRSHVVSHGRSR